MDKLSPGELAHHRKMLKIQDEAMRHASVAQAWIASLKEGYGQDVIGADPETGVILRTPQFGVE